MSLDLAAVLVEAGAATAEALERAAARQRELGGALDTALLELELVDEARLTAALSRATGLPAAPPDVEPDPRARRVFPARVAERHGLAPYRLEGRELLVVAVHPVDLVALDEISFMLSLHLTPSVAPEWRVRELMSRVYGVPLPERFAALAARAHAAAPPPAAPPPAPAPTAAAPAAEAPAAPADAPRADAVPGPEALPAAVDRVAAPAAPAATPAPDDDFAIDEEPLAAALSQAIEAVDPGAIIEDAPRAPPHERGPPGWSREEAFAALDAARTRDDVVDVALRYTRDFFEATALFAVTRDRVSGHDALGWDRGRERCRAVRVRHDAAGLLQTVLDTSGPYLGPVAREPGNEELLRALGRAWPRLALAYPVALRGRVVCILYADNGAAPVSPRRLGDLLLLCAAIGGAFDRILLEAKRRRGAEEPLNELAAAGPPAAPAIVEAGEPRPPPVTAQEAPPPEPPPAAVVASPPPPVAEVPPPAAAPEVAPAAAPEPAPQEAPISLGEAIAEPQPPVEEAPPVEDASDESAEVTNAWSVEPAGPEEQTVPGGTDSWELREPARLVQAEPEPEPEPEPLSAESAWATAQQVQPFEVVPPEEMRAPPAAADEADAATRELVSRLCASAPDTAGRDALVAEIVRQGPDAAAALRDAFPGPIERPVGPVPVAACGPVLRAMAALGPLATPYLVQLLAADDALRRRVAVMLLGAMGEPASFLPIAERVLDADGGVADAALAALEGLRAHPDFPPVLERLRRALASGEAGRPARAALALGQLGDAQAVPLLIEALEMPPIASAAAEALRTLTARRLGQDAAAWLAWWREHREERRADWLFTALADEDREVRDAAAAQLQAAAGTPPVTWDPDAPGPARLEAARQWRSWWDATARRL